MKQNFYIKLCDKKEADKILLKYHYLKDISKGYRSGYIFGLYNNQCDEILGVAVYTNISVPEIAKGAFGLERNQQEGLYELSRLCIHPEIQNQEYNITSWFLSRTIKKLKSVVKVRAILSYADSQFHKGTIYAACNFKYYGLTEPKKDFWIKLQDGTYKKHTRGKVKGLEGEWRPRTRKHRFLLVFDKSLNVLWKEEKWNAQKN